MTDDIAKTLAAKDATIMMRVLQVMGLRRGTIVLDPEAAMRNDTGEAAADMVTAPPTWLDGPRARPVRPQNTRLR